MSTRDISALLDEAFGKRETKIPKEARRPVDDLLDAAFGELRSKQQQIAIGELQKETAEQARARLPQPQETGIVQKALGKLAEAESGVAETFGRTVATPEEPTPEQAREELAGDTGATEEAKQRLEKIGQARALARDVNARVDEQLAAHKPVKATRMAFRGLQVPIADPELERLNLSKKILSRVDAMNPENTGFVQGLKRAAKEPERLIPFVGSLVEAGELLEVLRISRKEERGEKLTGGEDAVVDSYAAMLQAAQNFSPGILDRAAEVAVGIPAFALEFAGTAGLYSTTKEGAKKLLSKLATRSVAEKLKGTVATKIAEKAVTSALGGAAQAAVLPGLVTETVRRQLPKLGVEVNQTTGNLARRLDGKGEDFVEALTKAYGLSAVEAISERTGGLVQQPLEALKKQVLARWIRQKGGVTATEAALTKLAERAGWNGIVGEVFEEQVAKPFRSAIEGQPLTEDFTLENLAVESLGFTLFGGAAKGFGYGVGRAGDLVEKRLQRQFPQLGEEPVKGQAGRKETVPERPVSAKPRPTAKVERPQPTVAPEPKAEAPPVAAAEAPAAPAAEARPSRQPTIPEAEIAQPETPRREEPPRAKVGEKVWNTVGNRLQLADVVGFERGELGEQMIRVRNEDGTEELVRNRDIQHLNLKKYTPEGKLREPAERPPEPARPEAPEAPEKQRVAQPELEQPPSVPPTPAETVGQPEAAAPPVQARPPFGTKPKKAEGKAPPFVETGEGEREAPQQSIEQRAAEMRKNEERRNKRLAEEVAEEAVQPAERPTEVEEAAPPTFAEGQRVLYKGSEWKVVRSYQALIGTPGSVREFVELKKADGYTIDVDASSRKLERLPEKPSPVAPRVPFGSAQPKAEAAPREERLDKALDAFLRDKGGVEGNRETAGDLAESFVESNRNTDLVPEGEYGDTVTEVREKIKAWMDKEAEKLIAAKSEKEAAPPKPKVPFVTPQVPSTITSPLGVKPAPAKPAVPFGTKAKPTIEEEAAIGKYPEGIEVKVSREEAEDFIRRRIRTSTNAEDMSGVMSDLRYPQVVRVAASERLNELRRTTPKRTEEEKRKAEDRGRAFLEGLEAKAAEVLGPPPAKLGAPFGTKAKPTIEEEAAAAQARGVEMVTPQFDEGQRVTWTTQKGTASSGTVRSQDGENVRIRLDKTILAGGVPIAGVVTVKASKLRPIEGTAEVPLTPPPSESTVATEEPSGEPSQPEATGRGRTPSNRPLEGISPEAVPRTPEEQPARTGGTTGIRPDRGRGERAPEEGPQPSGGVGERAGELAVPAERGRPAKPRSRPGQLSRPGKAGHDYHLTAADIDHIKSRTPLERFTDNIAAIKLLKQIEAEGRLATPEEQQTLVRYVGWGGLPQVFDTYRRDEWGKRGDELRELLTEEELEAARASTPNAHYTSPEIATQVMSALQQMGFQDGRILEPGMGIGLFFGAMPSDMAANSARTGVELDPITGRIAKQLFQTADVRIESYGDTVLPDNFYDAVIGNVPFGDFKVHDARYNKDNLSIHNYFIVKSLDKLRPGGLMGVITSHFTLDATNSKPRQLMAERADLIGAIRLPYTAFKGFAGTEVVTDILLFRKRAEGEKPAGEPFKELAEIDAKDEKGITYHDTKVNEYFVKHPEMVLGTHTLTGTMYADKSLNVEPGEKPLIDAMTDAIREYLPDDAYRLPDVPESTTPEASVGAEIDERIKPFGVYVEAGKVFQRIPEGVKEALSAAMQKDLKLETTTRTAKGELVAELNVTPKEVRRIDAALKVRDQLRAVLKAEVESEGRSAATAARGKLNKAYDAYRHKYGNLTDMKGPIRWDPDFPLLTSLETFDPETKTLKKSDIFFRSTVAARERPLEADTSKEALLISLGETGKIDWPRISGLLGKPPEEIQTELRAQGLVFHNPEGSWETQDAYLSGNVRQKLAAAEAAAKVDQQYEENVAALKEVQPKDLTIGEVNARLGAPWIDKDFVEQFVAKLLDTAKWNIRIAHSAELAAWKVDIGSGRYNTENTQTWGTERAPAAELIEESLNQHVVTVFDYIEEPSGKRKAILNEKETVAAREKQEAIQAEFGKWVATTTDVADTLAKTYNEQFNSLRLREFDGSHLILPGMSAKENLRPHQKNAIWRILQSGNTLLAHVVGAGKTYVMVGAAMEMRRLGMAKKPMIVVPKHIVGQIAADFRKLYPAAKILVPTEKDFTAGNRQALMSRIATGDWDAVIVGHSSFKRVPLNPKTAARFIQEEIDELEDQIRAMKAEARSRGGKAQSETRLIKEIEKAKFRLQARLKQLMAEEKKDITITFEETGVDALFVDEAHYFKNLFFATKMGRVSGVNTSNSERAFDLFVKSQLISKQNNGRGIVFSTATPISNSMSEMYTLQRYLAMNRLKELGLQHFDAWAGAFGESVNSFEVAPEDPSRFRTVSRFSRFTNLPELLTLFREFADVKTNEDLPYLPLPEVEGGKPIVIDVEPSEAQQKYVAQLGERADAVRKKKVDPTEDNMLKITGDGRRAALDMRAVYPSAAENPTGKLASIAEKVYRIWDESKDAKLTQTIMLDISTPTAEGKEKGFTAYAALHALLTERGIPADEIAFIHDHETDAEKQELFRKFNAGEVRVLIGSTDKLGVGANIQKRHVALHHADAPWRPTDIDQRDGRLVRQGNDNKTVQKYIYVTKGTFDAYMWQTIQRKLGFVNQALRGKLNVRHMEDVDGRALTAAEAKALATGNPIVMEKIKNDLEVQKYSLLKAKYDEDQTDNQYELARAPERIKATEEEIAEYKKDIQTRDANKSEEFTISVRGKTYSDRAEAGAAINEVIAEMEKSRSTKDEEVGKFSGFVLRASHDVIERTGGLKQIFTTLTARGQKSYIFKPNMENPLGTIQSLEATLRNIEDALAREENELARIKTREKKIREEAAKGFAHAAKLQKALAKQAELMKALDLTKSDNQAASGQEEGAEEQPPETFPVPRETPEAASLLDEADRLRKQLFRTKDGETQRKIAAQIKDLERRAEASMTEAGNQEKTETFAVEVTPKRTGLPPFGRQRPVEETGATGLRRGELLADIRKILDIPFGKGRFKQRALGVFKAFPWAIRTKFKDYVPVDAHELGHALNKYLWGVDSKQRVEIAQFRPYRKELIGLVPENWPASRRNTREGFAEFIRHYLIDQEFARFEVPEFTEFFERELASRPELEDAIRSAQQKIQTYLGMTPEEKVKSDILFGEEKRGRKWKEMLTVAHNFDEIEPLERATKRAFGTKRIEDIPTEKNPYILAEAFKNNQDKGRLLHFLKYGPLTWQLQPTGTRGLFDILEPLDSKERLEDFATYLVSRTAIDRLTAKPSMVLPQTKETYKKAIERIEAKHSDFRDIAEEFDRWGDDALNYYAESGRPDPEVIDKIRSIHRHHVPLYRHSEQFEKRITSALGSRFAKVPNPLKRAKGGTELILNPVVSKVLNVAALVNAADRWDVQRAVVDLAKEPETADIIEEVDAKKYPITFNLQSVARAIQDATGLDLAEEELDVVAQIWRDQDPRGLPDNIIVDNRGGKRKLYELKDPELVRALNGLLPSEAAWFVKLISVVARTLRTGVVLPVDFVVRNVLRDQPTAAILSNRRYIPYVELARGIANIVKETEAYKEAVAQGLRHYGVQSLDRKTLDEFVRQQLRNKQGGLPYSVMVRHPLEAVAYLWDTVLGKVEDVGQAAEMASRLSEFTAARQEALARGETPRAASARAAFEAGRVTVNFSKVGWGMKAVAQMAAFFNPNLQGQKRVVEAHIQFPWRTMRRGLLYLTIPSILLYLLNRDDEEYQEFPLWRKLFFWHIPVHRLVGKNDVVNYVMIPKPWELGFFYGSLPEMVLSQVDKRNPAAVEKIWEAFWESAMPDPRPTLLQAAWHQATGRDAFGRPIETEFEKGLEPEYRAKPWTPQVWKRIGGWLGMSPARLQQGWRDTTGTIGGYVEDLASKADDLVAGREGVEEAERRLSDLPFFRGFVAKTPGFGAESIQKFYEELEQMEQTYRTARLPLKGREVDPEVIARAEREGILTVSTRGEVIAGDRLQDFRDTQQYLRTLRTLVVDVQNDRQKSPQEKRQDLNRIEQEAVRSVRELLAQYRRTTRPPFGTQQRVEARP